jgi:dTDP-4-amino-4,6-dideoxygalactose transaminase
MNDIQEKFSGSIEFINLKAQQAKIRSALDSAIKRVLDHGLYIMGPEIIELEAKLAEFCGVKHAVTCANGTDALILGLMAKNVRPGEAIFVPSFTFAATAEVVVLMGAVPVFIDVLPDTYNMDPVSLEMGLRTAKVRGLKPSGIIPVDLFGQAADYTAIQAIADQHNLWILADAAQSFGGKQNNTKIGNFGFCTATSFFPAKPLGCYGDGGAIFTNDDELALILKSFRVHGQGIDKYDNVRIGMNGRLDTLQAAILLEKLKLFPEELLIRQAIADFYTEKLKNFVIVPSIMQNTNSTWAQYTIRLRRGINRNKLMEELKESGIPTMIYYPKPLHKQKAYEIYPVAGENNLPVSEMLSEEVLSLPMNPYLTQEAQSYIISQLIEKLT